MNGSMICETCGGAACLGFDVRLLQGRRGRWYCWPHAFEAGLVDHMPGEAPRPKTKPQSAANSPQKSAPPPPAPAGQNKPNLRTRAHARDAREDASPDLLSWGR